MARSWQDIIELPAFQALDTRKQEALRNEYFRYVVAPEVATEDLDAARATFDQETGPRDERTWGEALADTGLQLAEGGLNVLSAPVSLVAPQSDLAEGLGGAGDWLRQQQSLVLRNKLRAADAAVDAAGEEGFWSQLGTGLAEYGTDPALASRFIMTNLPSMIPSLAAGRVAQLGSLARSARAAGVAPEALHTLDAAAKAAALQRAQGAALTAAGGTNAVLNAGGARQEAYDDLRQTLIDQGVDPLVAEQQAATESLPSALVGGVTGYLSGRLGLESAMAGRALGQGGWRAGLGAAGSELAGEQVEELAPQATTNLMAGQYDQRPLTQDLGQTAAQTLIGTSPGATVAGLAAGFAPGDAAGTAPGAVTPPRAWMPPNVSAGQPPGTAGGPGAAGPSVNAPSGTLGRAAAAGQAATVAGAGVVSPPSPEELYRAQQDAMRQQQQQAQQQQRAAQQAQREQERARQDAARQAQDAEKIRQAQLKTQQDELKLNQQRAAAGLPPMVGGASWEEAPPDVMAAADEEMARQLAGQGQEEDAAGMPGMPGATGMPGVPTAADFIRKTLGVAPDAGAHPSSAAGQSVVTPTPPAADADLGQLLAVPEFVAALEAAEGDEDMARQMYGQRQAAGAGTPPMAGVTGTPGAMPGATGQSVMTPEAAAVPAVEPVRGNPQGPRPDEDVWSDTPDLVDEVEREDGLWTSTRRPSRDGRWDLYEDISPDGEVANQEVWPRETAAPVVNPPAQENTNGQSAMQGQGQAPDAQPPTAVAGTLPPAPGGQAPGVVAGATEGRGIEPGYEDYELRRNPERLERVQTLNTEADLDALLKEEEADDQRSFAGWNQLRRRINARRSELKQAAINAEVERQRDAGEWVDTWGGYLSREDAERDANRLQAENPDSEYRATVGPNDDWTIKVRKRVATGKTQPGTTPATQEPVAEPAAEAMTKAWLEFGFWQAEPDEKTQGMERMFRTGWNHAIEGGARNNLPLEISQNDNWFIREGYNAAASWLENRDGKTQDTETTDNANSLVNQSIKKTKEKLRRAKGEGSSFTRIQDLERELRGKRQHALDADDELATKGYVETTSPWFPDLPQKPVDQATNLPTETVTPLVINAEGYRKVHQENVGRRVRIRAVTRPEVNDRAAMVGKTGTITRALKGDQQYVIKLDDGGTWRAQPDNVEAIADDAPGQAPAATPTPSTRPTVPIFDDRREQRKRHARDFGRQAALANEPRTLPDWVTEGSDLADAWQEGYSNGIVERAKATQAKPAAEPVAEPVTTPTAQGTAQATAQGGEAPAAQPAAPAVQSQEWGANNTLVSRERAEELRKRARAKLGQLNSGIDPEMLAIMTELAAFHLEAGARRFGDYARAMAADLGASLEQLRPFLRSAYNGARDMMEDHGLDITGTDDPDQVRQAMQDLFSAKLEGEANGSTTTTTTTTETTNDNRGVPGGDQKTLEEVAAGQMEGTPGGGTDRVGNPGGGTDGATGETTADAVGVPGVRGGRGGPGGVYPPQTGVTAEGEKPGRRGGRGGSTGRGGRTGGTRRGGRRAAAETAPELTPAEIGTGRVNGVLVAPPAIPARNFTITDEIALGEGGQVRKFNDNLAAIRVVKTLAAEGRRATPEEQATLARYVGWGGIPQAFPSPETGQFAAGWQARGEELRAALGGETSPDYRTARRSTQYAHFTSRPVIQAMWDLAQRLGFRGGLVLESAAGIGNFLGLMPQGVRGQARTVAVEMDGMTARILQALYPQAAALHSPTNKLPLASESFDLAIGNPPYAKTGVRWQYKPWLNGLSLHNQFVLADLDNLKPNGLYLGVVTRYLLDAQDSTARERMADQAEFLGAIRLPDAAFQENALTEVVTDILVFRKRGLLDQTRYLAGAGHAAALRKNPRTRLEPDQQADLDYYEGQRTWTETGQVADPLGGEPMTVGRWYVDHPDMLLGTLERSGTMRAGGEVNLKPLPGVKISEALNQALTRFPVGEAAGQDVIQASLDRFQSMADALAIAAAGEEPGAMRFDADGALVQVLEREAPNGGTEMQRRRITADSPWSPRLLVDDQGRWFELKVKTDAAGQPVKQTVGRAQRNVYERTTYASEAEVPATLRLGALRFERLQALVRLRDLLKEQIVLETRGAEAEMLEANRTRLKAAYDAYVAKHGLINEDKSAGLVAEMPDGALVLALELGFKDGLSAERARRVGERPRPPTARPAEIMTRRVILPYEPPTTAASVKDALVISLGETGRVDVQRIAALTSKSPEEAQAELTAGDEPLVFLDPETERLETRDAYLSGQVRRKLEAARAADLTANVAALEAVQPPLWTSEQVTVKLGAPWVPEQVWADFINHLTHGQATVRFTPLTNSFEVRLNGGEPRLVREEWGIPTGPDGTPGMPADKLVDAMLNSRSVRLGTTDDDGRFHLDEAQTELAKLKMSQIAAEFADWIFADTERRQRLTALFNEKFNTRLNRQHDGSHLVLPGKVPDTLISLYTHQKNAIWRGIVERALLIDHVVGAGKTFTAIARAMERRRMGLAKKPMIVVPNHLVESWAADVYRLYPGAKVLAAGKADFERNRRRRLFAKIATGDWDIVIVPHSSFGKLGISPETEERYLQEALQQAIEARDEAQAAADEDPQAQGGRPRKPLGVKAAEALIQKIENRLEALRGKNRDNLLTFEELGVDDLTIDEAHEFKNLYYNSNLQGVRGMGDRVGSQKAMDLYNKVRTLHENPNGAIVFMTGTPISNSAVEMYTLMRYLAPKELAELGLEHFDAWRAQYVDSQTSWEMNDTARLQEVTRLGPNWSNMRSLMELYYSFTDAVTLEDIRAAYAEATGGGRFPVPDVVGGGRQTVKVAPTPAQESILQEVVADFDALPNEPDPDERNAMRLRLMDRARKVSLDARAVNPSLPTTEPGGKLEQATNEIERLYRQWDADRGTQLVFLDRSVPKSRGDAKILKEYDALKAREEAAVRAQDEAAFQAVRDALERYDPDEMAALRAAQAGGWNAYQQLKDNLVARGIPANQIRFVQEANTDEQKKALFDAVNLGEVRILIGSTPRMGAGTNVQERLVALHHLDVNWKPSDIEQREGRIIRQGNSLLAKYGHDGFQVAIMAYVTERTVDAKMWELNAKKLTNINGIRKYAGQFEMEFSDEESASMAETAALASGEPLLLERVKLKSEIEKLEMLERAHRRRGFAVEDRIKELEHIIARYPQRIADEQAVIEDLRAELAKEREAVAARTVTVEGRTFNREQLLEALGFARERIEAQKAGNAHAPFSLNIGGNRYTTRDAVQEAIEQTLGDEQPFAATIEGEEFWRVLDAGRALTRIANGVYDQLELKDPSREIKVGTLLGADLIMTIGKAQYKADKYRIGQLTLERDGATLASTPYVNWGDLDQPVTVQTVMAKLREVISPLRSRALAGTGYMEYTLSEAREELPNTLAKRGAPFAQREELATKRARLREVIGLLAAERPGAVTAEETAGATAADGTPATDTGTAATDGATEGARYSRADGGGGMDAQTATWRLKQLLGAKVARVLLESGLIRLERRGAGVGWKGETRPDGTFVLNLDALNVGNFDGTLGHEGFHAAVRDLLGAETYAQVMARLEKLLAEKAPWVERAKKRVPGKTAAQNVTEEVGAYAVEDLLNNEPQPGLLRRWAEELLSALRTAIIRRLPNGRLKNWALANLQARDLAKLAIAGLRAKSGGQLLSNPEQLTKTFNPANPDIRYSLADGPDAGTSPLGGGQAFMDSVKQAWSDRWTQQLPRTLGALSLRQLAEVGSAWVPGLKLYDRIRTRMETRRNVMMEEAGRLGDAVDSWARKHRDEARQAFKLMNDSTAAQVDPSNFEPLMVPLQLGPGPNFLRNWAATDANVQELRRRVRVWSKSKDHRERAAAAYYAKAARILANAARGEKKRQAAAGDLIARWEALSDGARHLGPDGQPFASEQAARTAMQGRKWPKGTVTVVEEVEGGWAIQELGGKQVYTRFRDLYQKRSEEMLEALIARVESLESLSDDDKRVLAARIRREFESPVDELGNPRVGPYFPFQRFGRWYVFARKTPEGEPRTWTRQDGSPFASAAAAWAALRKRQDLDGVNARPVEREDGSGWELREVGEEGFWLFESVAERREAVAQMKADGWEIRGQGLTAEAHRELDGVSEGFVAEAIDKLKAQGSKDEADTLYQMYLQTLQQMSIRKHFLHRKGTKGYTADQLRAFGWNMTRLAHQISKLESMPILERTVRDMEDGVKEARAGREDGDVSKENALLEEVKKRHEWIAHPENSPWTNAVSALGFIFYLGLTPAAALVNLGQVPIVALPVLAARVRGWAQAGAAGRAGGAGAGDPGKDGAWRAASAALTQAMLDVARGFKPAVIKGFITGRPMPSEAANLTDEERAAFAEWDKTGARDRTQAHNLAGIGDADSWLNGPTFNRVMGAISSLFHAAEVVNRDATLLAGYRLARARGISHEVAVLQAEEATWEAHFDYSNANRARFMQGDVAKVLLMFKNYAQHVLFFLGRNLFLWARGQSPEVRREARTKFAGMVGMTALFAGASGLPLGGAFVLANVIQALFGDDDEPWDAETEWQRLLERTFPKTVAEVIDRGPVNLLTGLDFASRVSIADLIWRSPDRDLDGAGMYQHVIEQLLGPVGGIVSRPFTMYDHMREGEWARAAEAASPKFMKDLLQAGRFTAEGVMSRKGDEILAREDLSSWELVWKAFGLQPDELQDRYERNAAVKLYEKRIIDRRRVLLTAAALALIAQDREALAAARAKIAQFNKANPEYPIQESSIRRSAKSRQQMRERARSGVIVNPKLGYLYEQAGGYEGERAGM